MGERANFQKSYLNRYAIMAAICWGAAAWFGYDGFIGYPKNLPMAEAYDELRDIEDAAVRIDRWQEVAKEKGWPTKTPTTTAEEWRNKINGQYFYMALCICGGIPALLYFLRCRGTWVEPTADGLTTSWGQTMKFADVTELNKKRWAKKGIAKATYSENGSKKTFVFDDFKFERDPLGKMLRDLESSLDRDKIVGGPTEVETDAEKAAAKAAEEAEAEEDEVAEEATQDLETAKES